MQDKLTNAALVGDRDRATRVVGSKVNVGRHKAHNNKPEIHVNKQGERIESIVITCSCGEQVTVFCDYNENQS